MESAQPNCTDTRLILLCLMCVILERLVVSCLIYRIEEHHKVYRSYHYIYIYEKKICKTQLKNIENVDKFMVNIFSIFVIKINFTMGYFKSDIFCNL